ncbi:MAG: aldose epimerase family protein [Luteolibacter sp.]
MDPSFISIPGVHRHRFGTLPDRREASVFTIINANGLRARVSDYGALLISMETPDRDGTLADLTHGYDAFADWLENPHYFGATVGRFGNRIARGKFTLDGKTYQLATNNAPADIPCHLHGGLVGFDKHLWDAAILADGVEFTRSSPDGEEGYPGKLDVKITYRLTDDNELIWQAEAVTDAATPVNLIHHSYWNLSGDPHRLIHDHELVLEADHFLPTNPGLIPTGEIAPVAGTPMDFTEPTAIGARIDADFEPLHFGNGYDHAWVLRPGSGMRRAARIRHPGSGRVMEILTDQPAIQLYTGNFVEGVVGKSGVTYANRSAFCLETEAFPDAPNQPAFPSSILRPGETYRHTLIHRFMVD